MTFQKTTGAGVLALALLAAFAGDAFAQSNGNGGNGGSGGSRGGGGISGGASSGGEGSDADITGANLSAVIRDYRPSPNDPPRRRLPAVPAVSPSENECDVFPRYTSGGRVMMVRECRREPLR